MNDSSEFLTPPIDWTGIPRQLLIVIAVYNERENLPLLFDQLFAIFPESAVLIIDDNSPDKTGMWCLDQSTRNRQLKCIIRGGKRGLGTATLLGLQTAIDQQFDFVATLDADGSHEPSALSRLVAMMTDELDANVDVVIGSRYVKGGRIVGWPLTRRIFSRIANGLTRWVLSMPTKDNTSAFRVYRVESLRKIDLSDIKSVGYSYLEELLYRLHRRSQSVVEMPITFRNRTLGQSKANWKEGLRLLGRLLKLRFFGG